MELTEQFSSLLLLPGSVLVGAGIFIIIVCAIVWSIRRRKSVEPATAAATLVGDQAAPAKEDARQEAPARDLRAIKMDIDAAEKAGDHQALAGLHLEHARGQLALSDGAAAADQLRRSVVLATTHDLKQIHASARLELANLSEADGDLTTACEHWQIARNLFHALERNDDVQKTDARMLSNGCPTDWVLTDF